MALLHDERQHAEAGERRQDRRDRRRQRDHDRAERHRQHDERDADDVEQEERQALHDPVGDVLERRRLAGDVRDRVAALGRRGHDVAPQVVDEVVRRLVLRRRGRRHEDDRDRLLVVELRLADGGDAVEALDAVVDPLRRLLVAVHVDDDRDRPVEAGAEALREQVVRPPGRLLRRLRALVGRTQADERRRRGEREPTSSERRREHDLARCAVTKRPQRAIERPLPRRLRVVQRRQERQLEPVDLVAEQSQHGISSEFASSTVVSTPSALPIPSFVTKSSPKNASP